jgi:hypothetical protein
MPIHQIDTYILDDYRDRSFVYSHLCESASDYYSRLKYVFIIPIVLISGLLSLLNSNLDFDEYVKWINIALNSLVVVLITLQNIFKIAEKCHNFKGIGLKMNSLTHKIDATIALDQRVTKEFIMNIINEYDNLVESIDFNFPNFIKKKIRERYKTRKTLPLIINDIPKNEELRVAVNIQSIDV